MFVGRRFPFSLFGPGSFPFSLLGRRAFPFPFPPPPTSYPTLVGLIGISRKSPSSAPVAVTENSVVKSSTNSLTAVVIHGALYNSVMETTVDVLLGLLLGNLGDLSCHFHADLTLVLIFG